MNPVRFLAALGGLYGAAGVGLLALAAHGKWPTILYAALMALGHAPALLAAAAGLAAGAMHRVAGLVAALVLAASVALFTADVALSALTGAGLFPMAAPTGGTGAIAGWLLLAAAALLPGRGGPDGVSR